MRFKPIIAVTLALAAPAEAFQDRPPASASVSPVRSEGVSGLAKGMPVISRDGVKVAEVAHLYGKSAYGPNETFFTLAPVQLLRRIYGREAYLEKGQVRLRMTAAQFRARSQNPPDWINGVPPRR
jgi:hypothetical protein